MDCSSSGSSIQGILQASSWRGFQHCLETVSYLLLVSFCSPCRHKYSHVSLPSPGVRPLLLSAEKAGAHPARHLSTSCDLAKNVLAATFPPAVPHIFSSFTSASEGAESPLLSRSSSLLLLCLLLLMLFWNPSFNSSPITPEFIIYRLNTFP